MALTQLICLTGLVGYAATITVDIINFLLGVDRLLEYTKLPPEMEKDKDSTASQTLYLEKWPSEGRLEFKNVTMKYSDEDELVLKKLSFIIEPKQKVRIFHNFDS